MSKKVILLIVGLLLASTAVLGGLFAQGGTSGVSVSATGAAASGATVTTWSASGSTPSWSPIVGAVGAITGGGLAHMEVPNSPAGDWAITLFLDDPDELVQAYSYWNPKVQVRTMNPAKLKAGTSNVRSMVGAGTDLFSPSTITSVCSTSVTTMTCTSSHGLATGTYTITSNYTYTSGSTTVEATETDTGISVTGGDPSAQFTVTLSQSGATPRRVYAVSDTATTSTAMAVQVDFYYGQVVADAVTAEVAQVLNLEKGFVTFVVSSANGLCVNSSGVYQSSCSSGDNRAFEIGISTPATASNAGTFFTKSASSSDILSPEFTMEVKQR